MHAIQGNYKPYSGTVICLVLVFILIFSSSPVYASSKKQGIVPVKYDNGNGHFKISKDGSYKFYDAKGRLVTGWFTRSGNITYYARPKDGSTVSGLQTIDGKVYLFSESRRLQRNKIRTVADTKKSGKIILSKIKADKDGAVTVMNLDEVENITLSKKHILRWNQVEGADGYLVYRTSDKNKEYKLIKTIKSGSCAKYTDRTAKDGKKYHYKIKAAAKIRWYGKYTYVPASY